MDDISQRVIKGYELRELIGAGGFGAVYRAFQPVVEREVAIKVIKAEHANQPDFVRRFEAEAQLVARLEHLHIIPLYDYWRDPNGAYLVMRWLRGGSLGASLTQDGPWSLTASARLLDQIAGALMVAHHQGIVHLDIKPDNILLDDERNAYLTDFGIARELSNDSATPAGERHAMLGSPAYVSPEQVTRGNITPQTDIYSLGLVLYELLLGSSPFTITASNTTDLMQKHVTAPVPSLEAARPDLPRGIDLVIWRATAKSPEARYPDVMSLAADFRRTLSGTDLAGEAPVNLARVAPAAVGSGTVALESGFATPIAPQNPYKGLRAFEEADSADFFGRKRLVERLLDRLLEPEADARLLALVGPSGSGKSSVVKAGLIPTLRRDRAGEAGDRYIVDMTPGAHPFEQLAEAILRVAVDAPDDLLQQLAADKEGLLTLVERVLPDDESELLLIIDQFEEVFTLVDEEVERTRFLDSLHFAVTAPRSRVRLLLTLRADFYDRPLLYSGWGELIRRYTEVVLPLSPSELEQAIIAPAMRSGIACQPGLTDIIIGDLSEQPGALPLLQYVLTELFERRKGILLTIAAYHEVGGVLGALARRAEEIYESLDAAGQAAVRQLFLRLVNLGEGTDDTRRRVPQASLTSIGGGHAIMQTVIDTFGNYRLLTFDREAATRAPTIEVAHEALIREWQRLREWLDTSRDDLRVQQRLSSTTTEWLNSKRDPSFLASGARLTQFEVLLNSGTVAINEGERAYLAASVALRGRAVRRQRLLILVLTLFSLVALSLAAFAFDRQSQAVVERDRADEQSRLSRSRELAVTALTNRDTLDLALLLSLEALEAADTFEARNGLLTVLQSNPRIESFLIGHTDRVRSVAFSPDGKVLASGGSDNTIRLWDVTTRQPLGEPLVGHTDWVNGVAFSPDGRRLASASADTTVRLWDTTTGGSLGQVFADHNGAVWDVAFSPDGQLLASSGADAAIFLRDGVTGNPLGDPYIGHTGTVYDVEFSPDGQLLASGGDDNNIVLWDVASGQPIGDPLTGHSNWVLTLAFSPDGQQLVSSGADTTINLWSVESGQLLAQLPTGHTDWVRSLAFDLSGQFFASGSADGTVRLWNAETGRLVGQPLIGHREAVWDVAFSPDSQMLASASSDYSILLWKPLGDQPFIHQTFSEHTSQVNSVAFSPDGTLMASASGDRVNEDSTARVWDVASGGEVAALTEHIGPVTTVAFSPDGRLLATGSADETIILWDVETRESIGQPFVSHTAPVWSVAFSPDGTVLASGSDDASVILWDVATGRPLDQPLSGHTGRVSSVSFSPDGKTLASGSDDASVILWDVATGQPVGQPLLGHAGAVSSVSFSPDGTLLASGSRDASVILWDVATGQPVGQPLLGHADEVFAVAFSPDGQTLASAGRDRGVILWDVAKKQSIGEPFIGQTDWVTALAFSPDGQMLASGNRDTSIVLWEASPEFRVERACQVANRNLSPDEWERFLPGIDYHRTCPRP